MFSSDDNTLTSNVYPNPATNEIKFTTSIDAAYIVTIYNSVGKVIQLLEINGDKLGSEVSINITNFAKGNYFIKIDNHQGYFVSKRFQKL
jgi:hypothetical protein